MKHLFTTLFVACLSFTAVAQESTADKDPQAKSMSKEDKAAAKAQKEADLQAAFDAAGFTAKEQQEVRDLNAQSSVLTKQFKADSSLSPEEVKTKSKEVTNDRDAKIKAVVGESRYKKYKKTQKEQKEGQKEKAVKTN